MSDTTPEYVKMCEKAVRFIGKPEEPPQGSHFYGRHSYGAHDFATEVWMAFDCEDTFYSVMPEGDDWFPLWSQDQLQEMVSENPYALVATFQEWYRDLSHERFKVLVSMEQLWLALVMHQLYQKRWDSEKEDWVPQ